MVQNVDLIFETKEKINQLIKEEYHISNAVCAFSEFLFDKIVDLCLQSKMKQISENARKSASILNYNETFDGSALDMENINFNINMQIDYYDFRDAPSYEEYKQTNPIFNDASVMFRKRNKQNFLIIINVIVIRVASRFSKELIDSIQHEVNHIYQQLYMGDKYPNNVIYSDFYGRMISNPNLDERIIGFLLYMSDSSEQDSMINGLYAQCKMYHKDENVNDIIKNSTLFRNIAEIEQYIQYIQNNKEAFYPIIRRYYRTYKRFESLDIFLRYIKARKQRLQRKFANIVVRIKHDFIFYNESISFRGGRGGILPFFYI